MKIVVEKAESAEEYSRIWTEAMNDVHWFKEHRLFDYTPDEMTEDLLREFNKPGRVHFLAKPEGSEESIGILGIKVHGKTGALRRWEPAIPFKYRGSGAGEALVMEGLKWLRKKGALKASCMLKYPYQSHETALWHINLYKTCGFRQRGPVGVQLLADLSQAETLSLPVKNFVITSGDVFTLENFADFTLRAFASTPEDKAIHGWDHTVSNREESLRTLQSIKEGKLGSSPPECWKVALVEGKPAGFIGSFMPKSKYRPPFGVIGPLGVFPEFRRRGIAYSLTMKIHEVLKKHGCRYSYVGTPKTNKGAIRLYQKAGYQPVFELIRFEKQL